MQMMVIMPLMMTELLSLKKAIPIRKMQLMPIISIIALYRYQVPAAR